MMKSNALSGYSISNTRRMVSCALLIALSMVLKLIFEVYIPLGGFPSLRINLTSIPIMLSGILFGPAAGFSVGAISDLLCFVIKPSGPYFPGFTLASALTGMIPGLMWRLIKKRPFAHLEWFNLVCVSVSMAICIGLGVFQFKNGVVTYSGAAIHPLLMALFIGLMLLFVLYPVILRKSSWELVDDQLLFIVSLTQIICSVILNTIFLIMLYGQTAAVLLPARVITNIFTIPLYTICLAGVLRLLPESYKGIR